MFSGVVSFAAGVLVSGATLAASAQAATWTVTKSTDSNDGVCDADCSLREAVIAANASPGVDTIDSGAFEVILTLDGANEDASASGDLDTTDDVVIAGTGSIKSGVVDRVLHVRSGSTTLSGIDLIGVSPYESADYGGVIVNEADLVLAGSKVTMGRAHVAGGGLFNLGTATVLASEFTYDTVSYGGGPAGHGGAIASEGTSLIVEGSSLHRNAAFGAGSRGGALYVGAGTAEVVNTSFFANQASYTNGEGGEGGSIANEGATLTLTHVSAAYSSAGIGQLENVLYSSGSTTIANSVLGGGNVCQVSCFASSSASRIDEITALAVTGAPLAGGVCGGGGFVSLGGNVESPGASCGLSDASDLAAVSAAALALGVPSLTDVVLAYPPSSVATDHALDETCPAVDQVGTTRPAGPHCDSGAVEVGAAPCGGCPTTPGGATQVDLARAAILPLLFLGRARGRRRQRI